MSVKRGNTKVETYSAVQTVKCHLRSRDTTAIKHFSMESCMDKKTLAMNIRSASVSYR